LLRSNRLGIISLVRGVTDQRAEFDYEFARRPFLQEQMEGGFPQPDAHRLAVRLPLDLAWPAQREQTGIGPAEPSGRGLLQAGQVIERIGPVVVGDAVRQPDELVCRVKIPVTAARRPQLPVHASADRFPHEGLDVRVDCSEIEPRHAHRPQASLMPPRGVTNST
jgi:hypothetical protein